MKKDSLPTMKDVALEAGVSLGTVSKVFNGAPVSKIYRQKVLDAAQRLGYHVNWYDKEQKSGKTATVALILPNLQSQFFSTLAQKICESLRERECQMLLYIAQFSQEAEADYIKQAELRQVDGVIAVTYSGDLPGTNHVPMVTIDRIISPEIPCVSSDNYGGGKMAADKLMELGCERLLGLQLSCPLPSEPDKRIDGFRFACREAGVDYEICRESSDDKLFAFLKKRVREKTFPFDGIFCSTDELAYQVGAILKANHIKVPEQVQIIGYDGVRKFEGRDLFCSTMMQPVKEIADTAVDLLLTKDKQPPSILACLPVKYMAGGTTRD